MMASRFCQGASYVSSVVAKLEENEQGTLILTKDGEARFVVKAAEQTGGN